ncbi:PDZ domain-containing protein [Streptomyces sp. VMFN-G11Ma]|jgi:membrane-associated protease RseP (regulator of RpoE activity)|uniref:PDZ domain-containing protein n=1 Tax=Streptomyces sp. VMFN-G11Ma TaxID=2135609 RepID=UPI000D34A315|nr:PDZ domain-containing protein [Streptomyces sp. VMFN-G11Ma]PTN00193.1 PDZ domain-containing protein [Streptomyces sp. VMFN-G11Ma]
MEQTALRPKPMPGQDPGRGTRSGVPVRRPHAARRRARRLRALLFGLFVAVVLVLSGVGIGTVGATVIGMSKLADLQRQAPQRPPALPHSGAAVPTATPAPPASPAPAAATLGLEAVDAQKAGALIVAVHVPGPGYSAGLVRGDVLLTFGGSRVDTAADLARAVAHARPGTGVTVTVRHHSGGYQQLAVVPGFVM